MKKLILTLSAIAGCLALTYGQCTPLIAEDTSQFWTDGAINATAIKGNVMYLGGAFRHIGQYTGHFAVIDTATGSPLYRATWPKVNGTVYKAIPDGAGGWIVGGSFTAVGDSARTNMARIDAAGHVTGFNPHPNGNVKSLLLVGSDLYVGGDFTIISGSTRTRLAKMSFPSGVLATWTCTANNTVNDIEVYNDRLYAGGTFTTIGGQSRRYIAVIDTVAGTVAAWNANVTGAFVQTIIFNSGKAYVGGSFSNIGGQARNNVAALDTGTALAGTWNPNMNGAVNKLIHTGSMIYAAGSFSSVGGQIRWGLVCCDPVYGLPTSFDPSASSIGSPSLYIYANFNDMAISGNKLVAGGYFSPVTGFTYQNYMMFVDVASGTGYTTKCITDAEVFTVSISNGKLYAGGSFTVAGVKERFHTAAFNMDADTIMQWNFPSDYDVRCVTAGPSKIYVGGDFLGVYPYSPTFSTWFLVATDPVTGQYDTSFNAHIEYPSIVKRILFDEGNLYITGNFTGIDGYGRDGIAKINATSGALDLAWNPADFFTNNIAGVAADADNIYIGGYFETLGFQPRRNLGAVNKVNGHATAWNPSPTSSVTSISLNNGKLVVGGYFDSIGTRQINGLAKVDLTTGLADAWRPNPNGAVNVITPYYNQELIAGEFDHVGAATVNGLGIVNVNSNIPSSWNPHPGYDSVYDMATYGNRLYVAGGFSTISGQYKPNLIVYRLPQQPDTLRVSGPSAICNGTAAHFTAANAIPSTIFRWTVNGTVMGTAFDTFSYMPANGDVVTATAIPPAGGCYTSDTAAGNTITIATAPVTTPVVTIAGPSTVCYGSTVTYTSSTTVSGASRIWRVNGIATATTTTYSYTPANGDIVNCKIAVPVNSCYSPDTAVSNSITVADGPPVVPAIAISAASVLAAGVTVTVTATIGGAGSGYQVKWYKNGALVATGTSNIYSYVKGAGTDVFKATVVPALSAGCYDTMISNTIYVYQAVGIDDLNTISKITMYPDPFDGSFIVNGLAAGDVLTIYTADGRLVKEASYAQPAGEETVNVSGLAAGIYFMQVRDANGRTKTRLSIVKK